MTKQPSAEFLANYLNSYICEKYPGNRHVRRISTWLGFVLCGIEKIKTDWHIQHSRQILFVSHDGRRFKLRYNHQIGGRGGLEIVEVGSTQGMPDKEVKGQITCLEDAREFFGSP